MDQPLAPVPEALAHIELKAVISPILALAQAVELAKADGKYDVTDLQFLLGPMLKIGPAVAGAASAFADWKSMAQEERAKVIAWARDTFKLQDEKLERKIEAGLAIVLEAGEFLA